MKGRTDTSTERPMRKDRDLYHEGVAEGLCRAIRHLEDDAQSELHSRRTRLALQNAARMLGGRVQELTLQQDLSLCWWQKGER